MTNKIIFIQNTKELTIGDVILAIPDGDDIRRVGDNYKVRRAGVENVIEDDNLLMYDLDNKEHFVWDGNCDVTDDDGFIIVAIR